MSGLRRFWTGYAVLVAGYIAGSIGMGFGPAVESHFFPVRVDQVVDRIERGAGNALCWDWSGLKVRRLASDNLDLFIRVNGGEKAVGAVYRADTGELWRASSAPGLGPVLTRYCTRLPPSVTSADAVLVEWLAWYPSGTGLWRFSTDLPEIFSPGMDPPRGAQ